MNTDGAKRIGQRVKAAREAKGWDMSMLARKADVSASYISRLEGGRYSRPSLDKMTALAAALGTRVMDLVDRPANVPEDLLAEIRELVAADESLWREIAAELRRRPPEERTDAARWALEGLRLLRGTTDRAN